MSGVVSVGVAVTAVAAAVSTDFAVFAVIGAIGATVGAIGAVTKVKELQIAGAAIGVVGAVGGVASAAGAFGEGGVFGSGGTIFGGSSGGAGAASFGASGAGELGLPNAGGPAASVDNLAGLGGTSGIEPSAFDMQWSAAQANQAAGDSLRDWGMLETVAKAVDPTTASSPVISSASDGGDTVGGVAGESLDKVTPAAVVGSAGGDWLNPNAPAGGGVTTPAATAPSIPAAPAVTGTPTLGIPAAPGSPPTALETLLGNPASGAKIGDDSVWSDLLAFARKNPFMVSGAIQGAASFLNGALNPLTPAQIAAMKAQEKANLAAANRSNAETGILNQRLSNMQGQMPIASRITGAPQGVGLINSPTVTGVPA